MLEELAKHHNQWLKLVRSLGGDEYSEDIVQEMYLKMYKYSSKEKCFNDKGELNTFYVYLVLKSILFSYFREKKRIVKEPITNKLILIEKTSVEENEAFNNVCKLIDKEVDKWHWYDKQLFEIYRHNDISFRKIAKATGISWVSIYHTIKKCKEKLNNTCKEDWQDYINNDFELIKK